MTVSEHAGIRFVEGPDDQPLMRKTDDARLVIEACFSNGVQSALLYANNMTDGFFDLSSLEAGEILQKLRNYGIRVALVCAPGTVQYSSRFEEMAREESKGHHFRFFESAQAARDWLCAS